VADTTPIAGLGKLWSLYLDGNQLADLANLQKLTNLSSLDLRKNEVADLSPLANMTELRYLLLDENKIEDLGVLVEMARKDAQGQKRFAPFWNIYLADNPLTGKTRGQIRDLQKLGGRVHTE